MEQFDPVGGGFIIGRILDFFSGSFGGGGGNAESIIAGMIIFFKVIFIVFLILFIIGIVYVVYQLQKFRPAYKLVYKPEHIAQFRPTKKRWEEVFARFEMGTESDWRLAVIEADSLVDTVFKQLGYEGETLGERIRSIESHELHSINELKEAHGIRNKLVHTQGYKISREDAERSLRIYRSVLEELEVI